MFAKFASPKLESLLPRIQILVIATTTSVSIVLLHLAILQFLLDSQNLHIYDPPRNTGAIY